jgi:gamma-glutamylcyclotransferase
VINFAYGSNMLIGKIRQFAPSAAYIGVARLQGYRLAWHKPGAIDHSGKCDIVPSGQEACVYGVLYDIADEELPALNAAEGGYTLEDVDVECSGERVRAKAYIAVKHDSSLLPYAWYKTLVVAGARAANLPAFYVAQLESVEAMQDPDAGSTG